MKRNRLTLILVIVLLAIASVLIWNNSSSTLKKDGDFSIADTASVTKLHLVNKNGFEVLLERNEKGLWDLNNVYTADIRKVNSLLTTMKTLSVRFPVARSAHNSVVKRLATNSVKVDIYQNAYRVNLFNWIKLFPHESVTKTYYIGGSTQDNLGTYALMEGSNQPFVIHIPNFRGYISPRFSAIEKEWREHTVFNQSMDEIKHVRMEFLEDLDWSYTVDIDSERNITLTSLETNQVVPDYDTILMLKYLASFQNVKFESLLSGEIDQHVIDSVKNSQPYHRITLVEKNGDSTVVLTYHKKKFGELYETIDGSVIEPMDLDRAYALLDTDDFVLIQFYVFDKILRPLIYFEKD